MTWFNNWAYGYQPHKLADVPDLWALPKEGAGDRPTGGEPINKK